MSNINISACLPKRNELSYLFNSMMSKSVAWLSLRVCELCKDGQSIELGNTNSYGFGSNIGQKM